MSITRRLALIAPTALALLPLACEDSGVSDSGQAQAQLAAARTAYLEVVANRPTISLPTDAASKASDDEEARQIEAYLALRSQTDRALAGIANEISPLASSGNAAAGLMLAEVRLDQARLRMQDLLAEAKVASEARRVALALAQAAADLNAAAAANETMQLPAAQALREAAGQTRRDASSEQAKIQTDRRSVERLAESIESFRRRADELNADAVELQRQATSQNPIDAYDLIAEAADLRRMANEMAVEAATQEIAFETQGSAILALERDQLRLVAKAEGEEQAATVVTEVASALASQTKILRDTATGFRNRFADEVAKIELGAESVFGQASAAARGDFEAAAAAARRARSSGARDLQGSLDWVVVAARQGDAAVSVIEADAFAAQAAFLKAMIENLPNAPEADRWRRALESASSEAATARTRAEETFTEIADSIESLPVGGGSAGTLLQQEVRAALSRFAQREAGETNAPGRGGAMNNSNSSNSGAVSAAAGPPFASAEALLAFLQQGGLADGNPTMFDQVFAATSPAGRRALKTAAAFGEVAEPARAATVEFFGQPVTPIAMAMSLLTPQFEGATISSDDGAAAVVVTARGEFGLINQDGAWMVDFDGLQTMAPQLAMVFQIPDATVRTMGPYFTMFGQRVRDGEFASMQEARAAMQQQMVGAMGAAGGAAR
jgi:hypothetical protein